VSELWLEDYTPQVISSFDNYEQEYHDYLIQEKIPQEALPAISAKALFARPKLPITSYVDNFIYAGSLNLLAGEPKAGKSTLAWHLIQAVSHGDNFLGQVVRNTNVLYVTEQNEVSLRQEAEMVPGLKENPNIYFLMPETMEGASWESRVSFWGKKLSDTDSGLLVVDTFGAWANLPPGGENDSACIAERLMILKMLFKGRPNLGILLVHHIRKPSADPRFPVKEFADLRDARGSSAIAGCVDHCVMLSKAINQQYVRNIHTEGRFEPETKFSIVLTETGYKHQHEVRNPFRRV